LIESQGGLIAMDGTVFTALVSGVVALGTVTVTQTLTYFFSKKRDHEADWRKKKLEHYIEYLAAFSVAVRKGSNSTEQQRYADAASSLTLVAPPSVLIALYAFQNGLKSKDSRPDELQDMWSSLVRAMRKDCHPNDPKDSAECMFEAIDFPHDNANDSKEPTSLRSERAKP
jgi:hypothetical protein